eukprot:COSAG02_NODE_2247_length_9379_cov_7.031358_1_plen_68_part_00
MAANGTPPLGEGESSCGGGNGTPFAINRDSFCRHSGLLLPCNVTPFVLFVHDCGCTGARECVSGAID